MILAAALLLLKLRLDRRRNLSSSVKRAFISAKTTLGTVHDDRSPALLEHGEQ